ncbi:unannotated protein [freshwater metagenome]|uniref:Unannotated protein n=1 Tax=freshwater metagenome TaxID=449393 RepID=A0A6J7AFB6_9ZZZZ
MRMRWQSRSCVAGMGLGNPVVPEVWMISATSSGPTTTFGISASGNAGMTATDAPISAAAARHSSAVFSSATITVAPRLAIAAARSVAGNLVPSGAGTRPDSVAPTASAMASADSSITIGTG